MRGGSIALGKRRFDHNPCALSALMRVVMSSARIDGVGLEAAAVSS